MMKRYTMGIVLALAFLLAISCNGYGASEPVEESQKQEIKAALDDRSFRQFDPSKDGDPRRSVILDFSSGLKVWAQYSEGNFALKEWEIASDDYRIESRGGPSEVTLYFIDPRSSQGIPTECENCIENTGVSLSIRNALEDDNISFKLNDPEGVLPLPFPVFTNWTTFEEDEYFDG